MNVKREVLKTTGMLTLLLSLPLSTYAYNWDASTLPVNLNVGDNVSGEWQASFDLGVSGWDVTREIEVNKTARPSQGYEKL